MDNLSVKEIIIKKFNETNGTAVIPLMKSGCTFTATFNDKGVLVSNLGIQPLLCWETFCETVQLLSQNGGKVLKGDAMSAKLGDSKLPINSVEGYIANKIYGKVVGDSVFRRISPISSILKWAGICANERGKLRLINVPSESNK